MAVASAKAAVLPKEVEAAAKAVVTVAEVVTEVALLVAEATALHLVWQSASVQCSSLFAHIDGASR